MVLGFYSTDLHSLFLFVPPPPYQVESSMHMRMKGWVDESKAGHNGMLGGYLVPPLLALPVWAVSTHLNKITLVNGMGTSMWCAIYCVSKHDLNGSSFSVLFSSL